MIPPLFDHGACVIDSCGKSNKEYLDKLYRRAASITKCRPIQQADLYLTLPDLICNFVEIILYVP